MSSFTDRGLQEIGVQTINEGAHPNGRTPFAGCVRPRWCGDLTARICLPEPACQRLEGCYGNTRTNDFWLTL